MTRPYYAVKDNSNNKIVTDFVADKMKAKEMRNELNGPRPDDFVEGTKERYSVTSKEM